MQDRSSVDFTELVLTPKLSRVFDLLMEGKAIHEIVAITGQSRKTVNCTLSLLAGELHRTLPENLTYYHLLCHEFVRRQSQRLSELISEQGRTQESKDNELQLLEIEFFLAHDGSKAREERKTMAAKA